MSHRFYLPGASLPDLAWIEGREAHHALHVLRLEPGDPIELMNGRGARCRAEVIQKERARFSARVVGREQVPPPAQQITLAVSLLKPQAFDWLLEKAAELGAARIRPVLPQRAVVRYDPRDEARKLEKWRWTMVDAVKQCGNPWLPQLDAPRSLEEWVRHEDAIELHLVAALVEPTLHLRKALEGRRAELGRAPSTICVWIGPEGDFTALELSRLRETGARAVTLGPLVLRAETAAICALSVLQSELTYA